MEFIRKFAKNVLLEKKHLKNTSLHVAAKRGESEIFNCILEVQRYGNVKNKVNQTPLQLACKYGHLEIVKRYGKIEDGITHGHM